MRRLWLFCLLGSLAAQSAAAEMLIAARTLPAGTVLGPGDMSLADGAVPGALTRVDAALGLETRVAIYAGQPLQAASLAPPALVERNQRVDMLYRSGGLSIRTEGRALDRAGVGETLRVMNMTSKATVTGRVLADGSVIVGTGG